MLVASTIVIDDSRYMSMPANSSRPTAPTARPKLATVSANYDANLRARFRADLAGDRKVVGAWCHRCGSVGFVNSNAGCGMCDSPVTALFAAGVRS